jgi:hypothetical protein
MHNVYDAKISHDALYEFFGNHTLFSEIHWLLLKYCTPFENQTNLLWSPFPCSHHAIKASTDKNTQRWRPTDPFSSLSTRLKAQSLPQGMGNILSLDFFQLTRYLELGIRKTLFLVPQLSCYVEYFLFRIWSFMVRRRS